MISHSQQATFYRAALLLGVVPGETVVRWAEIVIHDDPTPPHALYDVALTGPVDLTALRNALQPIALEAESAEVIRAVLGLVQRHFHSGRRGLKDTVTVLAQLRRALTVPRAVFEEIDTLEDDFMLAAAGVVGDVGTSEGQVRTWLVQFAGADDAFSRGT